MRKLKCIVSVSVACLALAFTSCDTKNEGTKYKGTESYVAFAATPNAVNEAGEVTTLNATFSSQLDEHAPKQVVRVPIVRSNSSTEGKVAVEVAFSGNAFTNLALVTPNNGTELDTIVCTFAKGVSKTYIEFAYDFAAMPYYEKQNIQLTIVAEGTNMSIAPKNFNQLSPDLAVDISKPVPFKARTGKSIYFSNFWADVWEVDIDESDPEILPGFYRIRTLWGEGIAPDVAGSTLPGAYDIVIDARDPNAVLVSLQPIGLNLGDGMVSMGSSAIVYPSKGYSLGKKVGDVITLTDIVFAVDAGTYGVDFVETVYLTVEAAEEAGVW